MALVRGPLRGQTSRVSGAGRSNLDTMAESESTGSESFESCADAGLEEETANGTLVELAVSMMAAMIECDRERRYINRGELDGALPHVERLYFRKVM